MPRPLRAPHTPSEPPQVTTTELHTPRHWAEVCRLVLEDSRNRVILSWAGWGADPRPTSSSPSSSAVPRAPACPADAESGERGMWGSGQELGRGGGTSTPVLPLPSAASRGPPRLPAPSSLAPWSPPRELRVSREAPAAVPPPANQDPRTRTTPTPARRACPCFGNGPDLSLLFLLPQGIPREASGPMQRVTPPRGMTSVRPQVRAGPGDWEHQGLPPLNLRSRPLCLRRATEAVACGPPPNSLAGLACPP